jgi:hypothetical protein
VYRRILPQGGRWSSTVLGLDLALDAGKIRFLYGNAPLLEASELVDKLGKMLDEVLAHKQDAQERAREAERQAREADERAADLERRLREAEEENARLKAQRKA